MSAWKPILTAIVSSTLLADLSGVSTIHTSLYCARDFSDAMIFFAIGDSKMKLYPLTFDPIFKPKIWGGRKLKTLLGKNLPPDVPVGESWEIADLEDDQSVVSDGPAKGKTIHEMMDLWRDELLGSAAPFEGRFPLLIKFLDANETLSVQVHPDKAMAQRLGGRVRIKNETWYVVAAEPEGHIYRGVREGVDAAALQTAIQENRVEALLNKIPVRQGHAYYLPSGTIHALGAGVVVAEVQTPSDITYRVYDWNRVEKATGRPRTLHIEEAMQCVSFDTAPIAGEEVHHMASVWTSQTTLIRCESFALDRVRMAAGVDQTIPTDGFMIWMVLDGQVSIRCEGYTKPFTFGAGQTILIPAGIKDARVESDTSSMWLEASLPIASPLSGFERPDREKSSNAHAAHEKFVQIKTPGQSSPTDEKQGE